MNSAIPKEREIVYTDEASGVDVGESSKKLTGSSTESVSCGENREIEGNNTDIQIDNDHVTIDSSGKRDKEEAEKSENMENEPISELDSNNKQSNISDKNCDQPSLNPSDKPSGLSEEIAEPTSNPSAEQSDSCEQTAEPAADSRDHTEIFFTKTKLKMFLRLVKI